MSKRTPQERGEEVEGFFHRKAELVRQLHAEQHQQEAFVIATTALDALGVVWFSDFPADRAALKAEFDVIGGKAGSGIILSRFFAKFAPAAADVERVAVVPFAEDLARYAPTFVAASQRLLADRGKRPPPGSHHAFEFRELPHSHKDVSIDALLKEEPELAKLPRQMIEEYSYPALLYRFVRNPLVHGSSRSKRNHGFASGGEFMYWPTESGLTAIGYGPGLVSGWLEAGATGYVNECARLGMRPANAVDAGASAERALAELWRARVR